MTKFWSRLKRAIRVARILSAVSGTARTNHRNDGRGQKEVQKSSAFAQRRKSNTGRWRRAGKNDLETPGGQKNILKDGPGAVEIIDSSGNSVKLETAASRYGFGESYDQRFEGRSFRRNGDGQCRNIEIQRCRASRHGYQQQRDQRVLHAVEEIFGQEEIMKDFVQWTTPLPLWETAIAQTSAESRRAELNRPAFFVLRPILLWTIFCRCLRATRNGLGNLLLCRKRGAEFRRCPKLNPAPAFAKNFKLV